MQLCPSNWCNNVHDILVYIWWIILPLRTLEVHWLLYGILQDVGARFKYLVPIKILVVLCYMHARRLTILVIHYF